MRTSFFSWLLLFGLTVNGQSNSPQVSWTRQYISGYNPAFDFAYAIALDGSGNIIVIGSSWGSNQLPDIITIKYNHTGDTLWTRRWNGPGDSWDIGRALATDAAGNIYVTGETYSNSSFFDFITIKYDAAGNQLWEAIYDGPVNNDDASRDIAVDESGNVYVTGHSNWEAQTRADFATIKYNSSGQQQWIRRYNGPGSQADFGVGIALDQAGNVYVTGTEDDLSVTHYPAYATVKYNPDGVEQWVNRYNVWWSYVADIAVDASGNAYVTGHSYAPGSYYDYATVKYNSAGAQQWVRRYNGTGNSDDYAKAIKVDASGNVYVTGEAFLMVNNGSDYATIKYSSSGVQQWVARYNGPGNSVDVGNAVALDAGGNIYVTGESRGADGDDDYATVKYNPAGVEQWIVRYDSTGPAEVFDLASALAVDAAGCVYVTGRSSQVGSSLITTIKYNQFTVVPVSLFEFRAEFKNGTTTLKWETQTETNTGHFEIQRGFNGNDFNEIGNVVAGGNSSSLRQYKFEDRLPLPGINFYRLEIMDADGNAGYSKIISINTGNAQKSITVFPNPVTDKTIILQLNNQQQETFKIALYNSTGQAVYKNNIVYPGGLVTGTIKLPGNFAKGLYHLHVYSGGERYTQKLVIK